MVPHLSQGVTISGHNAVEEQRVEDIDHGGADLTDAERAGIDSINLSGIALQECKRRVSSNGRVLPSLSSITSSVCSSTSSKAPWKKSPELTVQARVFVLHLHHSKGGEAVALHQAGAAAYAIQDGLVFVLMGELPAHNWTNSTA